MKKTRKILSLLLAALIVFTGVPMAVFAEEVTSGQCGENVSYTLDSEGLLTISGEGAMTDYSAIASPFYNKLSVKTVIVENGVTSIGDYAFYNCRNLTSINVPDDLTSIGYNAFLWCTSLTNIALGNNVVSIGNGAFYQCSSLTSIEIPSSVTTIGTSTFDYCSSLISIDVAQDNPNYTSVDGVLFNKDKTRLLQYPIGNDRESYTILNGVTDIVYPGFTQCENLKTIVITGSVTSIDHSALSFCTGLARIDVATDNQNYASIDGVLFNKDKTRLIRYPVGNERISYIIPNSVTSIDWGAFTGCNNLINLDIPDNVTNIGNGAFLDCSNLTNIHYSGSQDEWNSIVIGINNEDLSNATVHFNCTLIFNYTWTYDGNCHLYISGEGAINYADEYGWEKYADEIMYIEISDGITSLPENIFSSIPYLTEVYLGSDVSEISSNSFADCPLLTVVTFNSNPEIADDAFENASQHLTFILNETTETPKSYAEQNNIKIVTTSYDNDKKMLNFTGDITVFDYTKYESLHNILYKFADTEYLYFTRLIFVDADSNIYIEDDSIDSVNTSNGLILNNVYVSLILVNEDGEQNVSFARMLELLESGDYSAFKYKAQSDEKEEEGTLFSKFIERIQRALQVITKLLNFIRKLFSKK